MKLTFLMLIFSFLIFTIPTNYAERVMVLRAARGYDARLPCGQGKVFLDGPNSYVVWLKDDRDFLYRFPEDEYAKRSLDPDSIYGQRCEDGVCYDETSLLLRNMSDKEGGLYTCRVHYQASPTDEYIIDIRLVEPAAKPYITTETGENPEKFKPISIGSNLTLICHLQNGRQESQTGNDTTLSWTRNGKTINSIKLPDEKHAIIKIVNITQAENNVKYECHAQNADVSLSFTTDFTVKLKSWDGGQEQIIHKHGLDENIKFKTPLSNASGKFDLDIDNSNDLAVVTYATSYLEHNPTQNKTEPAFNDYDFKSRNDYNSMPAPKNKERDKMVWQRAAGLILSLILVIVNAGVLLTAFRIYRRNGNSRIVRSSADVEGEYFREADVSDTLGTLDVQHPPPMNNDVGPDVLRGSFCRVFPTSGTASYYV